MKFRHKLVGLFMVMTLFAAACGKQTNTKSEQGLAEIKGYTPAQCVAYIEEKGVEIPKDYLNMSQESLEDFVYMVVQHHVKSIEEGKHEEGCKIVISYTVNYDFAMAICKSLPTGK